MTPKEQAIQLAQEAYKVLDAAGMREEFSSVLLLVAEKNKSTFFGSFGDDSGCFIEFSSGDSITHVTMVFGIRRVRLSFWKRSKEAIKMAWAAFRGYDLEHHISLEAKDVTRLKDLLRLL